MDIAETEMTAIESDPFGYIAQLRQQLDGACELLRIHASAIRNLSAENKRLAERLAAVEAANRTRSDEDCQSLTPQFH